MTTPWTANHITQISPQQLTPSPQNARKHSKAQIAQIAQSITSYGFTIPILATAHDHTIIAGHGRHAAALQLKLETVPVVWVDHLTDDQLRAYMLADNQLALLAEWDEDLLKVELDHLIKASQPCVGLDELLKKYAPAAISPEQRDSIPAEPESEPVSVLGCVYQLGRHRLMCGDSLNAEHVAQLCDGDESAALIHADPPYGMGKESDGVENDNLYDEKLDAFQVAWYQTWRRHLLDNGSVYIWGNPTELWRLWYSAKLPNGKTGLSQIETLTFRNEIVWDKGNGTGINSNEMRSYAITTERCLFFMLGQQQIGSVNKDDFWQGFESIRSYLENQCKAMGWNATSIKKITGVGMYGHWFTKSQFVLIPEKYYIKLQKEAAGRAFIKPYEQIRFEYENSNTSEHNPAVKFKKWRAHFDNAHDSMQEVWRFNRVTGEERFGHATPKPVDMIARAIISSSPQGGLVLEPFAGTGTTLIACEHADRICRTMEISPKYCDVIRRRWTNYAKLKNIDPGSGALE
jgi:DNA modification methylase